LTPAQTPPLIGVLVPKGLAVPEFLDLTVQLDSCGIDGVWLAEDCFTASGPAMAAMVLDRTNGLTVGLGILPAAARNVAFTAMEIATLANAHPGRLIVGIGHGMPEWMTQVGVWPTKPVAALGETISVLRRLLAGETVSVSGHHVHLDAVKLDQPPSVVPPVFAGVRRPASLKASGRVAQGTILAEPCTPEYIRVALSLIGEGRDASSEPHTIVSYNWFAPADQASTQALRQAIVAQLGPALDAQLQGTGFGTEILELAREQNDVSGSWLPEAWLERLAIWGEPERSASRVVELAMSGADWCVLAPPPGVPVNDVLVGVGALVRALRA
jgi:5,10-methylenetetrahydromethanopterin reductase